MSSDIRLVRTSNKDMLNPTEARLDLYDEFKHTQPPFMLDIPPPPLPHKDNGLVSFLFFSFSSLNFAEFCM